MRLAASILKIIFPSKCLFCNTFTQDDLFICACCWSKLEFITEPKCHTCSFPFQFDVGASNLCALCLQQKPCFDSSDSLLKYNFQSKTIVHKLKYSDQLHLAKFFAKLIVDRFGKRFSEFHVIVPVPMHKKRLLVRTYNQAAILASNIASAANLPFVSNIILKKRHDIPQTHLSRNERLNNVKGSFIVAPSVKCLIERKKIILVDDVYTTGTTLNECSSVLKAAGCSYVHVITLAKVVL